MNSISSIINSVQRDLQSLQQDRLQDASAQLKRSKSSLSKLTEQRNELLNQKAATNDSEKKLKMQRRIYILESWLKSLKSLQQKNLKTLREVSDEKAKINRRVLNILNEIDNTQTNAKSESAESSLDAVAKSTSQSVSQALDAALAAKHAQKATHTQIENAQTQVQKNALQQGASQVNRQLSAIKASKIIGTLFKAFKPLIQLGLQSLTASMTAGASLFFQGLINSMVELIEYALQSAQQHKMEAASESEQQLQNVAEQAEVALQTDQQQNQKSEAVLNTAIEKMQYANS